MFSGFCQTCCQKTYGIAFRGWAGQFHEINYNTYRPFPFGGIASGSSYPEPVLQADGSREWLNIGQNFFLDQGHPGLFSQDQANVFFHPFNRMRGLRVATLHDSSVVKCFVRLENFHNIYDLVYTKPISYMPSHKSVGVHRFTREDLTSLEGTAKPAQVFAQVQNGLCGEVAEGSEVVPPFSENDAGEVTLIRKDMTNQDNGFLTPGSTFSAFTDLKTFSVNCYIVDTLFGPLSFEHTNHPLAVVVPDDDTTKIFDEPYNNAFLEVFTGLEIAQRFAVYEFAGQYLDNGVPTPSRKFKMSYSINRLLWEAYHQENTLTIDLSPNLYMPLPGIHEINLLQQYRVGYGDFVGPFSATFTVT